MLQAAKSWTDNRNNMNNTRHNAYNSLLSAEYVGFASLNGLAWSSKALLALLDTYQSLLGALDANWRPPAPEKGMRNPDIIRNNSKNNRYNSEIIVK
jgi:hypothetical protein